MLECRLARTLATVAFGVETFAFAFFAEDVHTVGRAIFARGHA